MDAFTHDQLKIKLAGLKDIKNNLTSKIVETNDYKQRIEINKQIKEIVDKLTKTNQQQQQEQPKEKKEKKQKK